MSRHWRSSQSTWANQHSSPTCFWSVEMVSLWYLLAEKQRLQGIGNHEPLIETHILLPCRAYSCSLAIYGMAMTLALSVQAPNSSIRAYDSRLEPTASCWWRNHINHYANTLSKLFNDFFLKGDLHFHRVGVLLRAGLRQQEHLRLHYHLVGTFYLCDDKTDLSRDESYLIL